MARKRKRSKGPSFNPFTELSEETTRVVVGIVFFVVALFLILSPFELAGVVGKYTFQGISYLLGIGYYLLPLILFLTATTLFKHYDHSVGLSKTLGALLFTFSGLGIIDLAMPGSGGIIGALISAPLVALLDTLVSFVLLGALILVSLLLVFDTHLFSEIPLFRRKEASEEDESDIPEPTVIESQDEPEDEADDEEPEDDTDDEEEDVPQEQEPKGGLGSFFGLGGTRSTPVTYTPPPISLLERDKGKPNSGDTKASANLIKRTLQNFGIRVEMDEITVGPTVTRYALKPAEGVRISKIVSLQSNLELALAAHPIRIEAPIPGKSLVGIEVPNSQKTTLGLASLLSQSEFKDSDKSLLVTIGRDITGTPHYADISKMPHLLVAGTTGSGKSVMVNTLITSLIYRNSHEQMRFIMVDPKRVELTLYNGIPHLLTPVITEAKKTLLALKWAIKEMDRRYDILQTEKVRDIGSYHQTILAPARKVYDREVDKKGAQAEDLPDLPESMPYIVIFIDEMADLMQAYPRELEAAIVRLAQMSRAVGIHLVLSTQRPSVNVITGLIKANVPARIALQVNSQIDSRTILDASGAEKLLGKGDLLYISGEMSRPRRIQSPFVTEDEVKAVVKFLVKHNDAGLSSELELTEAGSSSGSGISLEDDAGDEDDRYDEAKDLVVRSNQASTSFLQRKMGLGYGRAAKIIDLLEERGIIGPQNGSKPREVLVGNDARDEDNERDDDE